MKHILITGSTRGIGYGLAKRFLASDCRVTINGQTDWSVTQAMDALKSSFDESNFFGVEANVGDVNALKNLWYKAHERFGPPDIWINNAGMDQPRQYAWELSPEDLQHIVNTNIIGVMYGSKVAIQNMLLVGKGQVYNMEGFGSNGMTHEKLTIYGATKRAVAYYTKGLIKELKDTPIQAGRLSPGMVFTDFLTNSLTGEADENLKAKKVFNALADDVDTVTSFLVKEILNNNHHGVHIKWLTPRKILGRLITAPFRKDRFFEDEPEQNV